MTDRPLFGNLYARLPTRFYARQSATPVAAPDWIAFNDRLAHLLQLDRDVPGRDDMLEIFSGNITAEGTTPLAMAYSGHQFGHWNPSLGDGRALLLGDAAGADGQRFDVQLKGSGPTPFSRDGDGRAALGPVLREYVISEAMHALGIPTTRALAAVTTGETVLRETAAPGAIITRVAKSFVRIGTFEYFAARKDHQGLKALADFSIARHEPDIEGTDNQYCQFLEHVIQRQADLVVKWQLTGFIHGVMNTDNMSVAGETIDYGPCAFMDAYDPTIVFSSIDRYGRYSWKNQPGIAQWNLSKFAQTLLPLLNVDENKSQKIAHDAVERFSDYFEKAFRSRLLAKIGIPEEHPGDFGLALRLLDHMTENAADFTNTFHALSHITISKPVADAALRPLAGWIAQWLEQTDAGNRIDQPLMRSVNPAVIPRNHRIEAMIDAATDGDLSLFETLVDVLSRPYEYPSAHHTLTLAPEPDERVVRTFCGT